MIKYRICRKQVLHKDLNEKDALEKMHQLKKDALEICDEYNKKFNGKIQTNISKIKNYCKAELYHQKYIEKNKQ